MSRWRRKESRTIPIPGNRDRGNGLDANQWYRCWYCGTINKVGVDALGGDSSPSGIYPVDYIIKEDPASWNADVRNADLPAQVVFDSPSMLSGNLLQLGPDGSPVSIPHSFLADITAGCRLCGSLNWRGDV